MQQLFVLLASIIFSLVAIAHLLRAAKGWPVRIGPYSVPLWLSWQGFVAATLLAAWGWWTLVA